VKFPIKTGKLARHFECNYRICRNLSTERS